jgi:hypothetical protein
MNNGFHKAVSDSIALNVTPDYLKKLGNGLRRNEWTVVGTRLHVTA